MMRYATLLLFVMPLLAAAQIGASDHRQYFDRSRHLDPLEGEWKVLMENYVLAANGYHHQIDMPVGTFVIRAINKEKTRFSAMISMQSEDYQGTLKSFSFEKHNNELIFGLAMFEGWGFRDTVWIAKTNDMLFHLNSSHENLGDLGMLKEVSNVYRKFTFIKTYPLSVMQQTYMYNRALNEVSMATCFTISNQGHVVTNHHVVAGGNFYHVRGLRGERWPAELIFSDSVSDIAVLQIKDTSFVNHISIAFRNTGKKLTPGEPLGTMGYPLGYNAGLIPKVFYGVYLQEQGNEQFISHLSTDGGCSGSPIFSGNAELVGVLHSRALNISRGTSADRLEALLNAHGIPHVLKDPPMDISQFKSLGVYAIDVVSLYTSR